MSRLDYTDAFALADPSGGRRSSEEWARAVLEGAAPPMRASLLRGWRSLGLRVEEGGDGPRVLGWPIARSTHDETVLATTSRVGFAAEIVFARHRGGWLFCTLVRCANPVARMLWLPLGPWHRQVVRQLLEREGDRP